MSVDMTLALELALAEVRRLRARTASPSAQPQLPGVTDELVAEAAQAAVQLRVAASRLRTRAPREATALQERAARLESVLRRVS
jgi:hypothetical protein